MTKTIPILFLVLTIISSTATASAGVGYESNKGSSASPYFDLFSLDSYFLNNFIVDSEHDLIAIVYDAYEEFMAWVATYFTPDYYAVGWKKWTGSFCEIEKIKYLQKRELEYLKARRDITIGRWQAAIANGEVQNKEGKIENAEKFYQQNVKNILENFLTLEFTKIIRAKNKGYSLLGNSGNIDSLITCNGQSLEDVQCNSKKDGEYCIGEMMNIGTGQYLVTDTDLIGYAQKAREKLSALYCQNKDRATPTVALPDDWNEIKNIRYTALEYIDTSLDLLIRAMATATDGGNMDMVWKYNSQKKIYEWIVKDKNQDNCLGNAFSDFVKINYQPSPEKGMCRCPRLDFALTDISGPLKKFSKNLGKLPVLADDIGELWGIIWDNDDKMESLKNSELGQWWQDLNEEAYQKAREKFRQRVGYYPGERKDAIGIWQLFTDFFMETDHKKREHFLSKTFNSLVTPPIRTLSQILQQFTKNGGSILIANVQNLQQKDIEKSSAQNQRSDKSHYLIEMVMTINNILDEGYGLTQAGKILEFAPCDEIKSEDISSKDEDICKIIKKIKID